MPEKDDKTEKTKTRVGVGDTEFERETTGSSSRNTGGYDDYDDDYQSRARSDTRDAGDNIRNAGRAVRRDATDLFSTGCDFLSGIFYGIGDALSPRRRSSSRSGSSESGGGRGSCIDECGVVFRGYGGGGDDESDDSGNSGGRPRAPRGNAVQRERVVSRTTRRTYP